MRAEVMGRRQCSQRTLIVVYLLARRARKLNFDVACRAALEKYAVIVSSQLRAHAQLRNKTPNLSSSSSAAANAKTNHQ